MGDAFKALADPTRRRILELLAQGELTAGEIAAQFDMTKPSVSHHLNILKAADLVQELLKWFYDCGFVKGGTDDEK